VPPTNRHSNIWRCAGMINLLAAISLSAGCATSSLIPASANERPPPVTAPPPPNPVPVVRYGRYGLVELAPDAAQQDLLQQVVDISIPATVSATVGDALGYLLLRSGYQRCEARDEVSRLYALPLPAAHLHLGPMVLRDALQTLAGPAWQLQVDDVMRQVCFTRAAKTPDTTIPTPLPSTTGASMKPDSSATTFELPEGQP
jgi:conjugative transfer region protein (TIGR03748 family)